ncbi:MAG: biotin/lipoyl-binding protein [Anaerolineae bacterium]
MKYHIVVEGRTFEIEVGPGGQVWVNQRPLSVDFEGVDGLPQYSLLVDHRSYETHVEAEEKGECRVVVAGRPYQAHLQSRKTPSPEAGRRRTGDEPVELSAPLPGLLLEVRVEEGQPVREGDVVAVLDSMKMSLELCAPWDGVIQEVHGVADAEVAQGEVVAVIGPPTVGIDSADR